MTVSKFIQLKFMYKLYFVLTLHKFLLSKMHYNIILAFSYPLFCKHYSYICYVEFLWEHSHLVTFWGLGGILINKTKI